MVLRIVFGTILLLSFAHILTQEAYAIDFKSAKPTFIWKIQTLIEDFRLSIATGNDRAVLAFEFAENIQTTIDKSFLKGERIPQELEERRLKLLNTDETQKTFFDGIRDRIVEAGELNQIRILYSEFKTCTETCTDQQKRDFNLKVNSLQTWKNKCIGIFDINDYKNDDASLDRLKSKCSDLNDVNKKTLRSFYGN